MGFLSPALDLAPLARLKVHLDNNQLVHGPAISVLDLFLVHDNLSRRGILVRTNNYMSDRVVLRALESVLFFVYRDQGINKTRHSPG